MELNFLREKKTYHSIKMKQYYVHRDTSEAAESLIRFPAMYFYDLLQILFDDEENTSIYNNAVCARIAFFSKSISSTEIQRSGARHTVNENER